MVAGLGDDVFEQDRPADERVAAIPDAGLDRQVQVVGFVDEPRDFGRRLGDVHQQRTTARWDTVFGYGRTPCCARPRVFAARRGR